MEQDNREKIKVIKGGPFRVTGGVKLAEKIIVPRGGGYVLKDGTPLPQAEEYSLCRCGKSKNAPFCDGAHVREGFLGDETASRLNYAARARKMEGPDLTLYDDNRCAYARFCHRDAGTAWALAMETADPQLKREAILAALECPTGRLVAVEKDGRVHEIDCEPCIEVAQDKEEGVSCGLFVKGGVELEAADGFVYEKQMRYALCRCGRSRNKPYCDAMHIPTGYRDR